MSCRHIAEIASSSCEPFSVLNHNVPRSKMMQGGEWHLRAPAACLLSCLIHSLYHLIRRMWRCGGETLSPWDRKAEPHSIFSSLGSALHSAQLASCMHGERCWRWRGGASCHMSTLHQVTHSTNGFSSGESWLWRELRKFLFFLTEIIVLDPH